MEHTESWKPQRSLAGLLASFAGLCVIGVRVGADHPLGQTMGQLGVAIGVAALVGYAAGWLLKVLIREAPVPACPEIYEVSEGRSVFDHYDLSFDRDAEAGLACHASQRGRGKRSSEQEQMRRRPKGLQEHAALFAEPGKRELSRSTFE